MDNAQKAIMIGVGLFITIIIISAVLLIVNLGTGLVDDATAELGSMSTTLQNQILQNYDGKTISGTQVRAAFQQYANDTSLCLIMVKNVGGTSANPKETTGGPEIIPYLGVNSSNNALVVTYKKQIVMGTGAKAITAITGDVGGIVKVTDSTSLPEKNNMSDFGKPANSSTTLVAYNKATASDWTNSLNSNTYINTAKNYDSSVIRNSTDTIVGIAFELAD